MMEAKTKGDPLVGWAKAISEMFDEEEKKNNSLTPSKAQLNNIVGCANKIHELTILMRNASDMAHQGIITFELAQRILDGTKIEIKETIGYLEAYMGSQKIKTGKE